MGPAADGPDVQDTEPDYWAAFEGIPLCHTPRTPEEEQALAEKGACRCG